MCVEEGCALLGRGGCGGGRGVSRRGVSIRVKVASISNQYTDTWYPPRRRSVTHVEDSEREAVVTPD